MNNANSDKNKDNANVASVGNDIATDNVAKSNKGSSPRTANNQNAASTPTSTQQSNLMAEYYKSCQLYYQQMYQNYSSMYNYYPLTGQSMMYPSPYYYYPVSSVSQANTTKSAKKKSKSRPRKTSPAPKRNKVMEQTQTSPLPIQHKDEGPKVRKEDIELMVPYEGLEYDTPEDTLLAQKVITIFPKKNYLTTEILSNTFIFHVIFHTGERNEADKGALLEWTYNAVS